MNKAEWRLLEKIQAGSMSDDEAFLLEREEDAYALAQAGYILIIGPGKQGSPHEGKCCAIACSWFNCCWLIFPDCSSF